MPEVSRNLSDDWKVSIHVIENFGWLSGTSERRFQVSILDRKNYNDPGHRTVWYKSISELEHLRDALDSFIKQEKEL